MRTTPSKSDFSEGKQPRSLALALRHSSIVEADAMTKPRAFSAALLVLGTLTTTSACTTGYAYGPRPYDNGAYYHDVERHAYENGFREGERAGGRDARSGRRYEPSRHDDWRDGDDGYRRSYGEPQLYRRNFRNGFEAGYAQGYRRN
jgi:hypothetical protein